jgi:hypothetical protein
MNDKSPRRSDDEIIRSMIEKENEYIHHRMTWLCTLQAFLFTSWSFAASHKEFTHHVTLLCIVGILVNGTLFHPIFYAHRSMMRLLEWWDGHSKDYKGPDVVGGRPPFGWARYIAPWHVLPVIFFVVWACILVSNIINFGWKAFF